MVRIVSQNFSLPRSRHSSGETDRDLAERADSALSVLGKKRSELGWSEYESSSDSFWDSEFDLEHQDDLCAKAEYEDGDINGNEPSVKSDVYIKRKDRRRERNKISAQMYRKRKRLITHSKQEELFILEEKNKHLRRLVNRLMKKTEKARVYLRRFHSSPASDNDISSGRGDAGGNSKSIPLSSSSSSSSLPATFAEEKPTSNADHHHKLNLNMNKNLLHQSSPVEIHQQVITAARFDGAAVGETSDSILGISNANLTPFSPILLNANNTPVGANNNDSGVSGLPVHVTFRSLASVKPKHGYYNANMNFKSPILRPSTLQTVPEIPSSSLPVEIDENITMPSSSFTTTLDKASSVASQGDTKFANIPQDKKFSCDSIKMALPKTNINLNNNNNNNANRFNYANDNLRQRGNNNCDNHIQVNSFQLMNLNGNLNQNAMAAFK